MMGFFAYLYGCENHPNETKRLGALGHCSLISREEQDALKGGRNFQWTRRL